MQECRTGKKGERGRGRERESERVNVFKTLREWAEEWGSEWVSG